MRLAGGEAVALWSTPSKSLYWFAHLRSALRRLCKSDVRYSPMLLVPIFACAQLVIGMNRSAEWHLSLVGLFWGFFFIYF